MIIPKGTPILAYRGIIVKFETLSISPVEVYVSHTSRDIRVTDVDLDKQLSPELHSQMMSLCNTFGIKVFHDELFAYADTVWMGKPNWYFFTNKKYLK